MSKKEDNSALAKWFPMPEAPKVRRGARAKPTQVQRDRTKYARASERRAHTNEEESE